MIIFKAFFKEQVVYKMNNNDYYTSSTMNSMDLTACGSTKFMTYTIYLQAKIQEYGLPF